MKLTTQMIRRGLAVSGLLASMALTATSCFAQMDDAKGPPPKMRERLEARCKADPQKCEEMKKRFEEKRAECKQDPAACKQKREAMHEKMKERREKCEQDPACKKDHPRPRRGDNDGPPPAPPVAQ